MTAPSQTFDGVQGLRFIAALLVVVTHATLMVSERLLGTGYQFWGPGRAGVDIFFVISGFVMAISSEKLVDRVDGWKVFSLRRLIRIVPIYWVATTAKLAAVIILPVATLHSDFDLIHTVASYLFLPAFNGKGELLPLLAVGWTLVFEMFFYAVFALALLLGQPPLRLTALIFGLLSVVALLKPADAPAIFFYADPMLLEFVYGMLVARILRSGTLVRPWLATLLVVAGFTLIIQLDPLAFSEAYPVSPRFLALGLPAMMIVLGTVYLEPVLRQYIPRIVTQLGDASYSLYLFHGLLLPVIGMAMAKAGWLDPVAGVLISMVASSIMSLMLYRWIESPTTEWLKSKTQANTPPGMGNGARAYQQS